MAIELAYINTKHPDFADACGLMNNNIEVNTIWICVFGERKSVSDNYIKFTEQGITIRHLCTLLLSYSKNYAESITLFS